MLRNSYSFSCNIDTNLLQMFVKLNNNELYLLELILANLNEAFMDRIFRVMFLLANCFYSWNLLHYKRVHLGQFPPPCKVRIMLEQLLSAFFTLRQLSIDCFVRELKKLLSCFTY